MNIPEKTIKKLAEIITAMMVLISQEDLVDYLNLISSDSRRRSYFENVVVEFHDEFSGCRNKELRLGFNIALYLCAQSACKRTNFDNCYKPAQGKLVIELMSFFLELYECIYYQLRQYVQPGYGYAYKKFDSNFAVKALFEKHNTDLKLGVVHDEKVRSKFPKTMGAVLTLLLNRIGIEDEVVFNEPHESACYGYLPENGKYSIDAILDDNMMLYLILKLLSDKLAGRAKINFKKALRQISCSLELYCQFVRRAPFADAYKESPNFSKRENRTFKKCIERYLKVFSIKRQKKLKSIDIRFIADDIYFIQSRFHTYHDSFKSLPGLSTEVDNIIQAYMNTLRYHSKLAVALLSVDAKYIAADESEVIDLAVQHMYYAELSNFIRSRGSDSEGRKLLRLGSLCEYVYGRDKPLYFLAAIQDFDLAFFESKDIVDDDSKEYNAKSIDLTLDAECSNASKFDALLAKEQNKLLFYRELMYPAYQLFKQNKWSDYYAIDIEEEYLPCIYKSIDVYRQSYLHRCSEGKDCVRHVQEAMLDTFKSLKHAASRVAV